MVCSSMNAATSTSTVEFMVNVLSQASRKHEGETKVYASLKQRDEQRARRKGSLESQRVNGTYKLYKESQSRRSEQRQLSRRARNVGRSRVRILVLARERT